MTQSVSARLPKASDILTHLENYRIPGISLGGQGNSLLPNYRGYSLANIPSSICQWLGVDSFGCGSLAPQILNRLNIPVDPPFKHVIFLLIDALGWSMFEKYLDNRVDERIDFPQIWARLLAEGRENRANLVPITSIVPSTTSAALTSLWTGEPPARHGVMGYEVWLKEYSVIANMIFHSPSTFNGDTGGLKRAGFQPETFLPFPTLGVHLAQRGVRSYAFQHSAIARSGLSSMLLSEVEVVPYRSPADLWVSVAQLLESRPDEKNYIYVYWGDVDELSHRFGPQDRRVALEFASFSRQVEYFLDQIQARSHGDTLFLLAADHGQIPTPRIPAYDLRNYARLHACLTMLPSGENRLPYVFVRSGKEKELHDLVEEYWTGQFLLLPSETALNAGLFGENGFYPRVQDRIGDYVVIPQGGAYWWWADKENPLLGRHGGLAREEMLIPLLGWVI